MPEEGGKFTQMRTFLQKNLPWLLISALLGVLALLGVCQPDAPPCVYVSVDGQIQKISAYENADGYHLFLPACAQNARLQLGLPAGASLRVGDAILTDGMDCSSIEPGRVYSLTLRGEEVPLTVYRSENTAALFLQTRPGTMDYLHESKDHKATASLLLCAADGTQRHADPSVTLKGRGNATWKYEKKPYSLTLSTPADLLGMGAAAEWVLLANATDQSNLYNRLALDLAAQSGLGWTPDSRYVEVYVNGSYLGLYLLTEKITAQPGRLELDSGEFLCKIEFSSRWNTLRNPFRTARGRTVEITAPKVPDASVAALVNEMEAAIFSGDDALLAATLDVDSWARRYLVDEICGNIDADLASSYFYYRDGRFYAGPVWDYDRAFGSTPRNHNPRSFIAAPAEKGVGYRSLYYGALCKSALFQSRVRALYEEEFLPILQALLQVDIQTLSDSLRAATQMNNIRWAEMFAHLQEADPSTGALLQYLSARTEFLSSAWLENVDYRTVQLQLPGSDTYRNFAVEARCVLDLSGYDLKADLSDIRFLRADTGAVFDIHSPVTENLILKLEYPRGLPPAEPVPEAPAQSPWDPAIIAASLGAFMLCLLGLLTADRRNRRPPSGRQQ